MSFYWLLANFKQKLSGFLNVIVYWCLIKGRSEICRLSNWLEKKTFEHIYFIYLILPVKLLYIATFKGKLSVNEQPRRFLDSDILTDILNFILLLSFVACNPRAGGISGSKKTTHIIIYMCSNPPVWAFICAFLCSLYYICAFMCTCLWSPPHICIFMCPSLISATHLHLVWTCMCLPQHIWAFSCTYVCSILCYMSSYVLPHKRDHTPIQTSLSSHTTTNVLPQSNYYSYSYLKLTWLLLQCFTYSSLIYVLPLLSYLLNNPTPPPISYLHNPAVSAAYWNMLGFAHKQFWNNQVHYIQIYLTM